jgi:hypothetical protein
MNRIRLLHITFEETNQQDIWNRFKTDVVPQIPFVATSQQPYPLIQFKWQPYRSAFLPMLLCMEAGIEAIFPFLALADDLPFPIKAIHPYQHHFYTKETFFRYRLEHWKPVQALNCKECLQMHPDELLNSYLKPILRQQLLHLWMSMTHEEPLTFELKLTQLVKTRWVQENHQPNLYFTIYFQTNLALPNYIGLGHQTQNGLGVITGFRNPSFNHP